MRSSRPTWKKCSLWLCNAQYYSTETVLLIFLFLQTNITVQMRPSVGWGGAAVPQLQALQLHHSVLIMTPVFHWNGKLKPKLLQKNCHSSFCAGSDVEQVHPGWLHCKYMKYKTCDFFVYIFFSGLHNGSDDAKSWFSVFWAFDLEVTKSKMWRMLSFKNIEIWP